MNFDITWTITAIIAVSSFLSPIAVAIINNSHHARIKKLELEHVKGVRCLDILYQASIRQMDIYYADKKNAFENFAKCAGNFSLSRNNPNAYEALHSSIDKAFLFCCAKNQNRLFEFMCFIDTEIFGSNTSKDSRNVYSQRLHDILLALNLELEATKPVINCE